MTRDQLTQIIKSRVFRPKDSSLDDKIHTEMQFVQEQLLENHVTLPWFLLSEYLSISTTAGEERLPLPANFLREYEEGALWIQKVVDERFLPLEKDAHEVLRNTYPSTALAFPEKYSLDGAYFRLRPVPDKAYTVEQKVYLREPKLTTNIENQWLIHAGDLMVAETALIIARNYLANPQLADAFTLEARNARLKLFVVDEARRHVNRDYQMGDD